ncbi:MAG TPA: ATP-binding protein [Ramlibacter sp.]
MEDFALDAPQTGRGAPGASGAAAAPPGSRRQEFDLLFECSLDGVLWVGPGGAILRANPAACELLAVPATQLLRMRARDLVAPCDIRAGSLIEQCRQHGRADGVLTVLRAGGTPLDVTVRMSHYRSPGGEPHALVLLRQSTAAAQPAGQRVADLPHLAPSFAHDLRAPLGTLAGFARALQRALGENAPQRSRHYVRRILAAVGQLEDQVEALLSFARIAQAPLAARRVDLSAIAHRILRDLQLRELDRAVTVQVQDGLCAEGDPHLLKIVLENLLGNAWKFTRRRADASIGFDAHAAPDGSLVYRVRDNGAGFDMAYAGKLFRDFQRLHSQAEFPGTGIGLANVQRILERHGGRVWAESAPGQGATFSFTLGGPAATADMNPPLRDEANA